MGFCRLIFYDKPKSDRESHLQQDADHQIPIQNNCETAIENLWQSFQQINCHLTFYAPKFLISGLCTELGNLDIPEFLPSAGTTRS